MGRVRTFNVFSNLDDFPDFARFVSAFLSDLIAQFNGTIDFVQNIRASGIHEVTFINSSQVESVSHKLGQIPSGYLIISQTDSQTLYKPSGTQYEWTSNTIYLQSTGSMVAKIYVI